MPRKARKSITTAKKDKSSSINIKGGGKVIKKQPTSIGRKVKTANIKCPKCSKPLITLNKTKSGVCVACLKNDSNNKSKNTVVPKSSLKPTKQVLNSSRKSNSKSNKSSNSPKTNSQKNLINATSSRSTLPTRARSVKSSATPLRDQPKTKNVTGKSKLTQGSKTDTMNLRGCKRSYTQMARGASIELEKTQKKRKINTNAEQLSKRESRNKKPTIKGSEWMNTIRSKRVSNQQEAKLKKETPPLKNKSPKSNSKLKNNIDKRKVTPTKTTKTANKSKTNKMDPGIVPHKPIKRTLKTMEDEDQISTNSKKLKSTASYNTSQKLQSTKGKNIISNSKKAKVVKKNKTEDVKKDGLAKYIKRQRSVRSTHKEHSPTDFQENVLIAKDIINNLLESIPPVPVDEISVVNRCDLDSTKLLEEKSTDKSTNLDSVKSKQNNCGHVKNDTEHNLYYNSKSVLHAQFEFEDKCNMVLSNNSTHIDSKCEQTDVAKDNLREENGSVLVTDNLNKDNHDSTTNSSKTGLSEDNLSEEKGTIVLRESAKNFVQSANSYTNNVDGENCIFEDDKKNLGSSNVQNNSVEEVCCFENDKSKINSRDKSNIEENFINVSEKENFDTKSTSNVTENITHTTPVNPKMVGDQLNILDIPNHKNVLEDVTDSSKEKESDCNRHIGVENEEEMTFNKSIMIEETNVEENSVSVQSESTAIETKFDENIQINSSLNHQSDMTFVNELSTNDKCSNFNDKVGIGESVNELMINESTDGSQRENDNIAYSSNKSGDCVSKLSIEIKIPESKLNSTKHLVAEEDERNMVLSNNSSYIDSKCEQTDIVKDTLREETGSVNVVGADNATKNDSIKENVSNYETESVSELSSSKNSFQNEANKDYSDFDSNSVLASDLKADGIHSHQNNIEIHSNSELHRFNADNNRTDAILCSQNNIIMDTSSSEHGGFLTSDNKTTNIICDQSNDKKDSIINRIDLEPTDISITNSLHSEKHDIKDSTDHHILLSTGNNSIDSIHNENKNIKDTVSNGIGHYTELSPGRKPTISTISCENDAKTHSLNTNFEQNVVLPTISTCNHIIDHTDSSESGLKVAASLSTENISCENNDSKNIHCFKEDHNALLSTDITCDKNDIRESSKDRINHDTTLPICRKITNDDNDTLNCDIGHNNTILLRDSKNPEKLLCDGNSVIEETLTSDIPGDVSVNVNKISDGICNQNNIPKKSHSAVDVCMLPTDGELIQSNYIKKGLCIDVDNSCENVLLVENISDMSTSQHSEPGIASLHPEIEVENKNEFTPEEKSSIDKNSSIMTDHIEVNKTILSNTSSTESSDDLHVQTESIKTDSTSNEINFRKPTETDIQNKMDSPGKIELKNNSSQNERLCIGSKICGLEGLDCDTTQFKNSKEFAQDKSKVQTIIEQLNVSTDTSVDNSETPTQLSSNVEATIKDVSRVNDCIENSGISDQLSPNIEEAVISVDICDLHSETNVQSSSNVEETVEDYSRPNVDDSAVHTETDLQMSSSVEDKVKDDINVHSETPEQSSSIVEETVEDIIRCNVDDDVNTETDLQISSNVEDRVKDDINVVECDVHSGTPVQSSSNVEETVEDVSRPNLDDCAVHTETDLQFSSNFEDRVKDDINVVECDVHSGTPVQSSSNVEETVEDVSRCKVDDCDVHSEIHLQVSSRVEEKVEDAINVNDCTVLSETPALLSSNVADSVKDIINTDDFVVVSETPVQLTTSVEETVENVGNVKDCVVLSGTAAPLPSSIEDSLEDVIHVDDCIVNVEAPFQLSSNVKDRVGDLNVDDCVVHSETVHIPSNGGDIRDDVINVDDDVESMQCNSETQSSSNRMSVDEDNIEMELDTEYTSGDNPSSAMNVDAEMNMEVN